MTTITTNRIDLITLAQIKAANPCAGGWRDLLRGLGYDQGKPDNRVVSLGDIATTNNAAEALWATRCLPTTLEARRFRVSLLLPALRRLLVYTQDERVHGAVNDLEKWVHGDDSIDLEDTADAAHAAYAAAYAAERELQRADIIALSPLYTLDGCEAKEGEKQ